MKNIILILFTLISSLAYSQTTPNIEKVLKSGNDANGKQIKDLADPTLAQDAATKAYVDANVTTLPISIANGGTGQITATLGFNALSPLTTRGDLLTRDATNNIRLAKGATGKFLTTDANDVIWSTSTIPSSAGATANKLLLSDGTNYVLSTPTFPNASATSGKIITSDGTNWVASTPTFPNSATSAGTILRADGTNWVASTSTYPNTATGTGTILRADGTNWAASTATYPNTGTANGILYATGTNVFGQNANFNFNGTAMTIGASAPISTELLSIQTNTNANIAARIYNNSTGNIAIASYQCYNDAGALLVFGKIGTGHTGVGAVSASRAYCYTNTVGFSFIADGSSTVDFYTGGVAAGNLRYSIDASGHLLAGTDNSFDIGAFGATRPRRVHAGTSVITPLLIGGTSTTQSLILKTTSGVGTTNADIIFQVGNNGATEAMRILNSGNVGIANTAPSEKLDVTGNIRFSGALMPNNTAGISGQVLTSAGAGTVPTWTTPATGGDASTNTATSVDNEIALFSSTTGKILKRATTTGMLKGTSGVLSAGTSGTDYSTGTSGLATGILKSTTGTGDLTIAVAGDFPTLNQNTTGTASNVTGTVAIANGGTGQTTATLGFNALSPVTTRGDIIVRGATNNDRLALGSAGKILRSDGTDLVYSTATYPNTIGASEIPYATSADVIGSNSAFTYNGTQLFIGNSGASATPLWIYRDINGSMASRVENISTGTIASANVRINNSSAYLMLSKLSTGYTTSGILTANAGVIDNASGNLILRTVSSTDIVFGNTSELFRMTSDGRLYGTAIHNNAGSVTGTTNQYVASGTYTFTLTNVTNVAASTAYQAQWTRVGNVVTVSGKFDLDATAASSTATELGLSLPIASNFAAEENLGGNASSDAVASAVARIKADAANDRAAIVFKAISATNDSYAFTFTYLIL